MTESVETGPPPTSDECRMCWDNPAMGHSWVDQGVVYWKCESCGHVQHEGVLEEVNREQIAKLKDMERAHENHSRFMREKLTRMQETYKNKKENPWQDIAKGMWDDADILYRDTGENAEDPEQGKILAEKMTKRIHALQ